MIDKKSISVKMAFIHESGLTMKENLRRDLVKLGLSDKEARVYLAALEFGPATAQQLAIKAILSRPTTYIVIESLIGRQLMSSFIKGKKRCFSASPPNQLFDLFNIAKRELLEKEALAKRIQEALTSLPKLADAQKTIVKVFDGAEGRRMVQRDILETDTDAAFELVTSEETGKFLPPIFDGDIGENIAAKLKIKSLYSCPMGLIKKQYYRPDARRNIEFRVLDDRKFPIPGEVVIYGNKISLTSHNTSPVAVIIEDKNINTTLRSLFSALWEMAEKKDGSRLSGSA